MGKIEELQEQVAQLVGLLAMAGIRPPAAKDERAADYIAHGSPEHAAYIGLIELKDGDIDAAEKAGYTVYVSTKTARCWRLEDEISTVRFYPGVDPAKALLMVLRQKVNALESGQPTVPPDAPAMWQPVGYAT